MNKKIRVLLLTLVLFSGAAATNTVSAASVVPETNGIFSPIGNFFSGLFGEKSSTPDTLTPVMHGDSKAITPSTSKNYASNTAYGTDADKNTDSGTGIIEITDKLVGITVEKTAKGAPHAGNAADPIVAGEVVTYTITVTNTGKDETVNTVIVTDDIAAIEGIILPVDADEFTVKVDPGSAITPLSGKVSDLQTGVTFQNVEPGEQFEISFSLMMDPLASTDFESKNTTKTCAPIVDLDDKVDPTNTDLDTIEKVIAVAEGYIYVGGDDIPDGIIEVDSDGNYFLCNQALANVEVEGDGNPGISIPDIDLPYFIKKSATSNGADATIARPNDVLTYQIDLTSYDLEGTDDDGDSNTNDGGNLMPDKKYFIQDSLDPAVHSSLNNLVFDDNEVLKDANGDNLVDMGGTEVTIAKLKSGFYLDIDSFTTTSFTFTATVKDTAKFDAMDLEDTRIKNTASICDGTSTTGSLVECVDGEGEIDTDITTSIVDINIEKDLLPTADTTLAGAVAADGKVDTSNFGKSPATVAGLEYEITLTNELYEPFEYVKFNDVLPANGYIARNTANIGELITVEVNGNAISDASGNPITDLTTLKVGDFVNGFRVDKFEPRTQIIIDFKINFDENLYTDSTYNPFDLAMIAPDNPVFTNFTNTCASTSNSYDDDGGCKQASASGYLDGSGIVPGADADGSIFKSAGAIDDKNGSGTTDAGDVITYTLTVVNDTDTPQYYALYDSFDDPAFRDASGDIVSKANLLRFTEGTPHGAMGTYDRIKDEFVSPADPFTVEDLNTPGTVWVELSGKTSATVEFDMTLTDQRPAAGDTNPPGSVENVGYICWEDGIDDLPGDSEDCNTSTEITDLGSDKDLDITKSSAINPDAGTSGKVDGGDAINYTITVTNDTTETDPIKYTIFDIYSKINVESVSDVDLVSSLDPATTYKLSSDEKEDFFDPSEGYSGTLLKPLSIGRGETHTFTYTATIKNPLVKEQNIINEACNYQKDLSGTPSNLVCAQVTDQTPDAVMNLEDWRVVKFMVPPTGSTAVGANDTLKVTFGVAHVDDTAGDGDVIEINEVGDFTTDPSFDENIDWVASDGNPLTVGLNNAADSAGIMAPTTVGDLIDTAATPVESKDPLLVTLKKGEYALINFQLNTVDSTAWTPAATEVENNITYCKKDSPYDPTADDNTNGIPDALEDGGDCDSQTGVVDTVGYENLSVKKYVDNVVDTDGTTVLLSQFDGSKTNVPLSSIDGNDTDKNGQIDGLDVNTSCLPTSPTTSLAPCAAFYVKDGAKVSYRVRTTNTGSLPVTLSTGSATETMVFTDVVNNRFYNTDGSETVTATAYDADGTSLITGTTTVGALATGVGVTGFETELLPGQYVEYTFDVTLKDNLSEILKAGETVTNVAKTCYYSTTDYNVNGGKNTTFCYQSGVDTPFSVDGDGGDLIPEIDVDDSGFTVDKVINDDDGGKLEPGEGVDMTITVVNNNDGYDEEGNPVPDSSEIITLTDEFADTAFNYEALLLATGAPGEITIENTSTIGATTPDACAKFIDAASISCAGSIPLPAINLLPKDVDDWYDASAKERYSDTAIFDEALRGGVVLEIPANQEYQITFKANANGSLRTISKIRNFFDIKKYFS